MRTAAAETITSFVAEVPVVSTTTAVSRITVVTVCAATVTLAMEVVGAAAVACGTAVRAAAILRRVTLRPNGCGDGGLATETKCWIYYNTKTSVCRTNGVATATTTAIAFVTSPSGH